MSQPLIQIHVMHLPKWQQQIIWNKMRVYL